MSSIDTAENIRAAHLSHEASVKSIGLLYYLSAFLLPCIVLGAALSPDGTDAVGWALAAVFLALGVVYFIIGRWLRALDAKARTSATVLACIGLLAVPIGTLINGYILYLIHSQKGKMVFSEYYRAVIETTPAMKYKTPLLVWIFVGLLLFIVAAVVIAAVVAK